MTFVKGAEQHKTIQRITELQDKLNNLTTNSSVVANQNQKEKAQLKADATRQSLQDERKAFYTDLVEMALPNNNWDEAKADDLLNRIELLTEILNYTPDSVDEYGNLVATQALNPYALSQFTALKK
jgi:hypothetical protein